MSASPSIAVILNITPNHLDRHKTMENYIAAKSRILMFQNENHCAILNRDDPNYPNLLKQVIGDVVTFGNSQPADQYPGVFIENESIIHKEDGNLKKMMTLDCLHLPGMHNRMNLLAACAASVAAGFPPAAMSAGAERVRSIPHRLELVREVGGVRWINDSIATAPERVIAAVHAIQSPLVLLLGGRDKDLPWEDLANCLREIEPRVILFGEAASMIKSVLEKSENSNFPYSVISVTNLEEAVTKAREISKPGDTVLLSPGGTSYDAYADFEERGRHFRELVETFA
jgi:UDP-N-acetylmuramoylalanine--D-glutamate ligase